MLLCGLDLVDMSWNIGMEFVVFLCTLYMELVVPICTLFLFASLSVSTSFYKCHSSFIINRQVAPHCYFACNYLLVNS